MRTAAALIGAAAFLCSCNEPCDFGTSDCRGTCVVGQGNTTEACGIGDLCVTCSTTAPNAHPQCFGQQANGAGVCGMQCNTGYADCNANVSDGCETSLVDPNNCGGCGVVCTGTCTAAGCAK